MYKVSVDESGTHRGAAAMCVAFCLSTSTQWRAFTREWEPYARKYPGGYHATKASDADNDALTGLVLRRVQGLAAFTFPYDDFKELTTPAIRSEYGNEYAFGVRMCLAAVDRWCGREGKRWVSWVLEAGCPGSDHVKVLFDKLLLEPEEERYHVFSHRWVGKEELITHPADLVAYEVERCYRGPASARLTALGVQHRDFKRDDLASAVKIGTEKIKRGKWDRQRARAERRAQRRTRRGQSGDIHRWLDDD